MSHENLQLLCAHCNRVKGDRPQGYLVARLRELGIAAQRNRHEFANRIYVTVMAIFEFISAIFGALAWPIAVVSIAIIFRKPLVGLIERISGISHNQTHIDIEPLVVSNDAAEIAGSLSSDEDLSSDNLARNSIESSPRAAIIEAWLTVEKAAFEALAFRGLTPGRRFMAQMIPLLQQQGLLDAALEPVLRDLLRTRNEATHQLDLAISPEAASVYVEIADRVAATLKPKIG